MVDFQTEMKTCDRISNYFMVGFILSAMVTVTCFIPVTESGFMETSFCFLTTGLLAFFAVHYAVQVDYWTHTLKVQND